MASSKGSPTDHTGESSKERSKSIDKLRLFETLRRIGPAVVVAAVVLGPGSIVSASRVGCQFGYELLWILPVAIALMISMTVSAMAVGVLENETPCVAVANRFGRVAAWLVGAAMLIAVTMFQASNNNALLMAIEGFTGNQMAVEDPANVADPPGMLHSATGRAAIPLLFNLLIIGLLWASRRDLYRWIEKAMSIMVGAMGDCVRHQPLFCLSFNQGNPIGFGAFTTVNAIGRFQRDSGGLDEHRCHDRHHVFRRRRFLSILPSS